MDTSTSANLAEACNADRRFLEAKWTESTEAVAALMLSGAFDLACRRLSAHGMQPTLMTNVAAVFACRLTERRRSGRVGGAAVGAAPTLVVSTAAEAGVPDIP